MITTKRLHLYLAILSLFLITAVSPAVAAPAAQEAVGTFVETECDYDLGTDFINASVFGFTCGYVVAPEDHGNPDGPTIRLPIAFRPATSSSAQPDPLFLAQGGPGGDAMGIFAITGPTAPAGANRDLVIFNQRGTRYSEPDLNCEELWDSQIEILRSDDDEATRLSEEAMAQCYQRLLNEEGINLSAYDSVQNAADIEIIRQALGYDSYNFYGVSYGSLLGLHLLRSDPPNLRSVILDSVVPTQINFAEEIPQSENRAYDEYFAACAEDAECNALYPNLEERITAVYAQLNETPARIRLRNSDTGESVVTEINGDEMRGIIFQLFYLRDFYAIFPRLVADLETGNYGAIENFYSLFAFDRSLSTGMYFSVFCAEDSDFTIETVDLTGVRPFIADTAEESLGELIDGCAMWQVEQLPSSIDDPVQSDIPTLLLSGRFDPITPPGNAVIAAETLPNSYNLVDPTGAHGIAFSNNQCMDGVVSRFLNDPTSEPSTTCIENSELLAPVPPDVIQIPNLLSLANLETGFVVRFGLLVLFSLLLLSGLVLWPLVFIIRRIRERDKVVNRPTERLIGRLIVLAVGLFAVVFIGGFLFYVVQIFSNNALLLYGGFPAGARLLFALVPLIILLTVVGVFFLVRSWNDASTGGKVYQAILMVSLVGISVLLIMMEYYRPLLA